MVFQDPGDSLDPLMSVEQIVAEPLLLLDRRAARRHRGRVSELLQLVGLDADFGKRRPLQLSGGQRQRVIARALATDPALVVCDEAVSSLDVSVRAQILNLLMELQRRLGLSYLFISHDLSTLRHVCDRVAVMYGGRFVEVADADDIFTAPQHPYTVALLSAVPIPNPALERERRRIGLEGLPDLTTAVPGCIFASRCWKAQDRCRTDEPALTERSGTHIGRLPLPGARRMSTRSAVQPSDLHDESFARDPFPVWERLRHDAPLFHDTVDDVYLLTRYEDVAAVLETTSRTRRGSTRRGSRR